jgi:DNA-binding transcriptional ArsR family regulator
MMDSVPMVELLQTLADPLRLAVLQHLMGGAAAVSELVAVTGVTQPNVSNHLAILRQRGLVRATRVGRQMVYEIATPTVARIVESLARAAGPPPRAVKGSPPLVMARTCYDHLAGKLGVGLFDSLVERQALQAAPANRAIRKKVRAALGEVTLGPRADPVFPGLGIDLAAVRREKRQFASACLDWTENRPHLGGALGAAIWSRFMERGWVERRPGSRVVLLTPRGRRAMARLGIRLEAATPRSG